MTLPLKHIRFGVFCDPVQLHVWQESVLNKLISEAGIELKLVVFIGNGHDKRNPPYSVHAPSLKPGLLWNVYYRHYIKRSSKALRNVETHALFNGIPDIHCDPILTDGHTKLEADTIAKIENGELDFMIDFSSAKLTGKVLNAATYGIWSFQFGNLEKYVGDTNCFWEIYNEDFVTSAYLTRLTDELDSTIVLREGHLKTKNFYSKNSNNIHFGVTDWPLKICHDIRTHASEELAFSKKVKVGQKITSPGNLQLLIFFFVQLKLILKKLYKLIFYTDYWNIGVVYEPIQTFLDPQITPTVQWFTDLPKSRFMADPFGMYFKDELFVVYEDLRFDQGIGKTASFLLKEGSFQENKIVIDEKFHMSYPFLLEHEGEIYCIPETYQANQVRLYKALEFPLKWKLDKVLIDNYAGIDNTPFKYGNTWFLFSTNKYAGPHFNLNIHYAESLFGPWREHPKNPVKTDIRSARPAGTLFSHNGDIFRPSMDYSEKIEGRIIINKISTLTVNDFREEVHNIVDPFENTFFSDKVHTLSQVGNYTLVDGAKELFIFSSYHALKYKIARIWSKLKKQ